MILSNPHRNTPTDQLETELAQLHDRLQWLQAQAERAVPGTIGAAALPAQLEQCQERRRAIFNELRRRRRK